MASICRGRWAEGIGELASRSAQTAFVSEGGTKPVDALLDGGRPLTDVIHV
jgi:hypothetical protein